MRARATPVLRSLACAAVLPACHTISSIEQPPRTPSAVPITTVAVAPPSGAFGNAVAEQLARRGTGITYTDGSRSLMAALGLADSTLLDDASRSALRQHGIAAVLTLVAWYGTGDDKPDSAKVRVVSTLSGADVAGVNWINGRGDQGSLQNATMRSYPSAAALVIGETLSNQLQETLAAGP